MDKEWMDKFNFVFGVVKGVFTVGLLLTIVVIVYKFGFILGEMEERINVLEIQNPIGGK